MATSKDLYMQFKGHESAWDGSNTTTLVEKEMDTGLSIRGGLVWLIHMVEWFITATLSTDLTHHRACLNSVAGQTSLPTLTAIGTLAYVDVIGKCVSSGGGFVSMPIAEKFLPPVPFAKPNLSLYCAMSGNIAAMQGEDVLARICFTTEELDQAMYQEIAEVWGW
jgi:hypothetical protein